jgi:hypothetical protein
MRLAYSVEGILLSEALAAEGGVVFTHACELGLEGIVSEAHREHRSGRERARLAEDEELGFL